MSDTTLEFFWSVAHPFLQEERIEKSTMMGYPCLRTEGKFFASVNPKSGDLVIKLPAMRVQEIIDLGKGEPFVPAGRRFREWVSVPDRDKAYWEALVAESLKFVDGQKK